MFSSNKIIGLDIGSDSIKMVEIEHKKPYNVISTYGAVSHNIDLSGYWNGSVLKQLAKAIEEVLEKGRFSSVKTVVSVSAKDVYVTSMDFDKNLTKKQIQQEILSQSQYFLPYPPNEMRLSWSLVKELKSDVKKVIINALPDFSISNIKNILEYTNLDGLALENQTIAQIRSLFQGDKGNTILVDVGGSFTVFSIIVNGTLHSSSYVNQGMDKVNRKIAKFLDISPESAEYFKKDLNLVNLYNLPEPVIAQLKSLSSELESFIDLNEKANQKASRIVFTGGGVHTPGFLDFFKDLKVPVEIGDPLKYVQINKDLKPYIAPLVNQISSVVGLALKNDI